MSDINHATISLKGSGKDALWIVLNGSADDMVQQVKDIFNFPEEQVKHLDPIELIINADSTLKAMTTVGRVLGGEAIKDETGGWHGDPKPEPAQQGQEDAWERAGAAATTSQVSTPTEAENAPENGPQSVQAAHPYQALLDELKAAPSIDELKAIWTRNRSAFKNDDVVMAYKSRGAEIKGV